MEDEEIIKSVLAGDIDQYAVIVDRYQQVVANLCYKIYGNKLDCEEVTQQVFVELYKALPNFKFKSKLSTFIYSITVNVTNKMYARQSRYVSPDEAPYLPEPTTDANNAEQEMMRLEQIAKLRRSIAKLHPEQREALLLFYFEEVKYQEIANIMQCSLSKVESLIFRAKNNLRKYMS